MMFRIVWDHRDGVEVLLAHGMSLNRAALLVALHRYLAQARSLEVRDGVNELEIQKIASLLPMLGQPSRLTFSRHQAVEITETHGQPHSLEIM